MDARAKRIFVAAVCAGECCAAHADELWPEVDLYKQLSPIARLVCGGSWARDKESDKLTVDLAAYADLTLEPFSRGSGEPEEWHKKKYLWVRLGYTHVFNGEGGQRAGAEERLVGAAYARAWLPLGLAAEARARADLRWISGDYSTRLRFRLELNRDFDLFGHTLTLYGQAEQFYDTRYDGWSRGLYQGGADFAVTGWFKVETYLARQIDRLPAGKALTAIGLIAKFYD